VWLIVAIRCPIGPIGSKGQSQPFNASGYADACTFLHIEGLQRDRVVGSAYKYGAAAADTHLNGCFRSDIISSKRAWAQCSSGGKHHPDEFARTVDGQIGADLG
jgi:hypothetical protein